MIGQILHGAWGTDVRAGMIGEIGCQAPWTATEKKVMQAALIAAAETGAAINVHPGRDPDQPQEVADFIRGRRGKPTERVVISHIDRTIFDEARLLRLADTRASPSSSTCSARRRATTALTDIDMPNDATRLNLIRALIDHGHLDRVVISHDICYRTRLASFGGHGYGHIFQERRADDEGARLQRGRDRRHPGAQPAAAADVRLVAQQSLQNRCHPERSELLCSALSRDSATRRPADRRPPTAGAGSDSRGDIPARPGTILRGPA